MSKYEVTILVNGVHLKAGYDDKDEAFRAARKVAEANVSYCTFIDEQDGDSAFYNQIEVLRYRDNKVMTESEHLKWLDD